MRTSRRRFLLGTKGLSVSAILAGCLSIGQSGSNSSPSLTPTSTEGGAAPVPDCPDGYESFEPWWIVVGPGPLDGFELQLDNTYYVGDELTAKLINVTEEDRSTGVKSLFDIQYKAEGWHTIFGLPQDEDRVWSKVGLNHPPGEGLTWTLKLSEEGLSEGNIKSAPSFHACQPIKPGNYRFVYWGVGDSKSAIGVPFTVASG